MRQSTAHHQFITERGKRMAASLAEYILYRYFFPDIKEKKRQQRLQEDFCKDMNFNLKTGRVTPSTDKLQGLSEELEELRKIFNKIYMGIDIFKQEEPPSPTHPNHQKTLDNNKCQRCGKQLPSSTMNKKETANLAQNFCTCPTQEVQMMIKLLEDFRFMNSESNLNKALKEEDKVNMVRGFQIKKVKAGERIFGEESSTIDCAHLILKGKTGILYIENELFKMIKSQQMPQNTIILNDNQVESEKVQQTFLTQAQDSKAPNRKNHKTKQTVREGQKNTLMHQSLEIKSEKKKAMIETIAIYQKLLNSAKDRQQDLGTKLIADIVDKYGDDSQYAFNAKFKQGLTSQLKHELFKRMGMEFKKISKTPLLKNFSDQKRNQEQQKVETVESEPEEEVEQSEHLSFNYEQEDQQLNFQKPLDEIQKQQYPMVRDLRDWWLGSVCNQWNSVGPRCPCGKSSCYAQLIKMRKLERFFGTLEAGDMFGESCMFGNQSSHIVPKPRFYQAFAITECYYLTIPKQLIQATVKTLEERILKEQIHFFSTIKEFKELPVSTLKKICALIQEVNFKKGKVLFREGEEVEKLYFIKSGIFRLQKSIEVTNDDLAISVGVRNWNSYRQDEDRMIVSRDKSPKQKMEWDNQLLECKNQEKVDQLRRGKVRYETKNLDQMLSGQILGLDETLATNQCYLNTAIQESQDSTLYVIDKPSFLQKLQAQEKLMQDLKKMSEARQVRVKKFLKNVKDVPKKLEREKLKRGNLTEETLVQADDTRVQVQSRMTDNTNYQQQTIEPKQELMTVQSSHISKNNSESLNKRKYKDFYEVAKDVMMTVQSSHISKNNSESLNKRKYKDFYEVAKDVMKEENQEKIRNDYTIQNAESITQSIESLDHSKIRAILSSQQPKSNLPCIFMQNNLRQPSFDSKRQAQILTRNMQRYRQELGQKTLAQTNFQLEIITPKKSAQAVLFQAQLSARISSNQMVQDFEMMPLITSQNLTKRQMLQRYDR